jgi:hypothetical protein
MLNLLIGMILDNFSYVTDEVAPRLRACRHDPAASATVALDGCHALLHLRRLSNPAASATVADARALSPLPRWRTRRMRSGPRAPLTPKSRASSPSSADLTRARPPSSRVRSRCAALWSQPRSGPAVPARGVICGEDTQAPGGSRSQGCARCSARFLSRSDSATPAASSNSARRKPRTSCSSARSSTSSSARSAWHPTGRDALPCSATAPRDRTS